MGLVIAVGRPWRQRRVGSPGLPENEVTPWGRTELHDEEPACGIESDFLVARAANPGAGCGIWKTLRHVTPPSFDFQTGAMTPGAQFPENATTAIWAGSTGFTAMLGSVSARFEGSVVSVAISTSVVAAEAAPAAARRSPAATKQRPPEPSRRRREASRRLIAPA